MTAQTTKLGAIPQAAGITIPDMAEWITTSEAARLSGYHPYYLRLLLSAGKINARKFGLTWQVDKRSLEAYMRAGERSEDKRRGGKFTQS